MSAKSAKSKVELAWEELDKVVRKLFIQAEDELEQAMKQETSRENTE